MRGGKIAGCSVRCPLGDITVGYILFVRLMI